MDTGFTLTIDCIILYGGSHGDTEARRVDQNMFVSLFILSTGCC